MAKRFSTKRLLAAIAAERERLYALLDSDPSAAISAARALRPRADLDVANVQILQAMVFIEAGGQLNDAALVAEGTDVFGQPTLAGVPDSMYNRANGLAQLARLQGTGQAGRLDTTEQRREVRRLFRGAAEASEHPTIRSAALCNLANELRASYRWIEAYDTYAASVSADLANGIALSGIASLLKWRLRKQVDTEGPIRRAAIRYLLRARAQVAAARGYAGQAGVNRIEELLQEFRVDEAATLETESPAVSPYADFVRRHRLALCVDSEEIGSNVGRWDHLAIRSVSQPIELAMEAPVVFTAWNALKADFLAARWLAYTAIETPPTETGAYTDTLDYANYGIAQSLLIQAQKTASDVLDKVAGAANDYLQLGGNPHAVYFHTAWHLRDTGGRQLTKPLKWLKAIEEEIAAGNNALIALTELAHDYHEGFLRSKKKARNAGTHRFLVLHDMWIEGRAAESKILDRHQQDAFERLTIESLQVARAALFYFQDIVSTRERRLALGHKGLVAPLALPSHHYIRGGD